MRFVYFLALNCLYISLHAHPVTESGSDVTAPIGGGLLDADVNDPNIKNVSAFALSEIDRRQNSAFKQVLVQIVSAKTQLVAGTLYHLRLEVGASNCRKGKDASSECTLKEGSNNQVCDVKVWDRPWMNAREVTEVSCSAKTSRKKRETLAGGLADADVNEEGVKNAADFALAEVDKRSNSAYKQTLVQILSAKKQVVAGTLYHLQLEVGESSCDKGSSKSDSECTLREGSNNQVCTVKVWDRPWLNKREVTQVDCSAKSQRRRWQTIPGGLADADVNEEGVKKAADFALTKIDEKSNSAYRQTLVKILSAKRQVVAGFLYHLRLEVGESNCEKGSNKADSECSLREGSTNQECNVKVWDRPWLHAREVTEVSCSAKNSRRKRETLVGGPADADVNEEGVKNAADFALAEVDKRSNSAYKQTLVQILSAKTQVVAGTLYHLRLEVGESSCDKGSSKAGSECTLREGSNNQVCNVKVWDRPWLNKREVTQVDCSAKSERRRRQAIPGGLTDVDVNEEGVKKAADFALTEIDKKSNSAYKQTLVKILSAKKQVVAGFLYHLQLEVGESSCDKQSNKAGSECSLREGSSKQVCNVKVSHRSWLNEWNVIQADCSPKSERKRRTAPDVTPPGGVSDADTDSVDIKSAAAYAVTEINNRQNSDNKLILVQILKAQSQIVEGTLHHLKLEIGESSCSNTNSKTASECTLKENSNNQVCDVKMWDRPWLNKREITELQCSPKSDRRRRAVLPDVPPGGLQDADVNDEAVKNAAAFAVSEIDKQQDSEYKLVLVEIVSAQTQIVAGKKYYLELGIGQSNCTKGNDVATTTCTAEENSNNQICRVEILEVPWENKKEASNINCVPKSESQKKKS